MLKFNEFILQESQRLNGLNESNTSLGIDSVHINEITCAATVIALYSGKLNKYETVDDILNFIKSKDFMDCWNKVDGSPDDKANITKFSKTVEDYLKKVSTLKMMETSFLNGLSQGIIIYEKLKTQYGTFGKIYWTAKRFPDDYKMLSKYSMNNVEYSNTSDVMLEFKNKNKVDLVGVSLKIGNPTLKNTTLEKLHKEINSINISIGEDSDKMDQEFENQIDDPFMKLIREGMQDFYNSTFNNILQQEIYKKIFTSNDEKVIKNINKIRNLKNNIFEKDDFIKNFDGNKWLSVLSKTFEDILRLISIDNRPPSEKLKNRLLDKFRDDVNKELAKNKNSNFFKDVLKMTEQDSFKTKFIEYVLETAFKLDIDNKVNDNIKKLEKSNINSFKFYLCSNEPIKPQNDDTMLKKIGTGKGMKSVDDFRTQLTELIDSITESELGIINKQSAGANVELYLVNNKTKSPYLKIQFRYKGDFKDLQLQLQFEKYLLNLLK